MAFVPGLAPASSSMAPALRGAPPLMRLAFRVEPLPLTFETSKRYPRGRLQDSGLLGLSSQNYCA